MACPLILSFPKGKSGNPDSRPLGSVSIKAELQKLLNHVVKGEVNPPSHRRNVEDNDTC